MNSYLLNSIPDQINQGIITKEQAIKEVAAFICKNYKVFELQKYDDDFRSEIIVSFLEHGESFLNLFNPEIGDFFTFLYCYINSMISSKIRSCINKTTKEKVTIEESINSYQEKIENYTYTFYQLKDVPKVPYTYNQPSKEELIEFFKDLSSEQIDKEILVLAMKSSFYLSDNQIKKVCKIYNLDEQKFYDVIIYLKNTIQKKTERRTKAEERRNYSYYHHLRCSKTLENIDNNFDEYHKREIIEYKKNIHYKNWKNLNNKFEDGYLFLRPTNKTIAELLGICERQVSYYINCAKNKDKNKKKKK